MSLREKILAMRKEDSRKAREIEAKTNADPKTWESGDKIKLADGDIATVIHNGSGWIGVKRDR